MSGTEHGDAREPLSGPPESPPAAPEPDGSTTGVWSSGVSRSADGALRVGGHDLRTVAAEHGTPAYVLDEPDLRARARGYAQAFGSAFADLAGADVYYAGKAFLSVAVARWVHEEGLRIDTSTGGELAVALRAGVPGAHLGLHGNNKSASEVRTALEAGVGRIVVDSLAEVELVASVAAETGLRAPVMLRVTTGVHAGGHEFIATAHEDQKFGLSLASGAAREAVDAVLAAPALELVGLHSHIGSQILDLGGFEVAARALLRLRAEVAATTGVLVPEVDLGGGYGVAYTGTEGTPPTAPQVAAALADVVARACADLGTPAPRISVEPGRSIVGPTTLTLYTVGTVKPVELDGGGQRLYVSVDGGMSDNLRPALYGATYTAALASRRSAARPVTARVVGKHCESGDIVVHDVALPADVRAGDLLAVPVTGAYGRSMASNYNLVPRPPVLAVGPAGVRAIVRGETVADLLALDLG
ncbi:diaminopimelate decarboxylase [Georgenia sp. 10Sc9-8]|uniref:Diaminopimelate decarboxylase n=1 Tax=Georgenia halotolerans TaxID=3028317 RepID=A0ABT5U0M2_9MICO|nr:diaminopimelate decarboxylase [Georgenia halotolerans]